MKLVRTTQEMVLAAELEPCPTCGWRDASTLKLTGSGTYWFLVGPCPRCRTERKVKFEAAENPTRVRAAPQELGPGPSQLLSPSQLLELYDLTPALRDPTTVHADDWMPAALALDRARTCINELLKLPTDGSEERLTRRWLEAERDRLATMQRAYDAEKPRISAEMDANGVPSAAAGDLRDATMLAHAQWLSRGRSGEGRLVLQGYRAVREVLRNPDFTWARLVECDFSEAVFGRSLCNHAELERDTLRGADLDMVPFRSARIIGGDWSRAILTRTSFEGATIDGTSFEGANLDMAIVTNARATKASYAGARFANAQLDGSTFEDCSFHAATFATRQRLPEPTSRGTRFVGCDLRDVDWSGRVLDGTTFVRCKLAGGRGYASTVGVVLEACDIDAHAFEAARAGAARPLGTELSGLLELVRPSGTPTLRDVSAYLHQRTKHVTVAGPNLKMPPWAADVRSGQDVFAELAQEDDVVGIHASEDSRGLGTYVDLSVRRGSLADVQAIVGTADRMPRQSAQERLFANPMIAGHRIPTYITIAGDKVVSITLHFEAAPRTS